MPVVSGSAGGSGAGSGSGAAAGSTGGADSGAAAAGSAVSVTLVPHPAGASLTVPLACSPSQATVVSGSNRVIVISPTSPRWRASDAASLTSAHSSGGDFTSRRDA